VIKKQQKPRSQSVGTGQDKIQQKRGYRGEEPGSMEGPVSGSVEIMGFKTREDQMKRGSKAAATTGKIR